jgi:LacI family transcriptional regulator
MHPPTILLALDLRSAWDRGVLTGIIERGRERGWSLILSSPEYAVGDAAMWGASVMVTGAFTSPERRAALNGLQLVTVTHDQSADGIPSVTIDESAVGELAAGHLLATGLRHLSAFTYDHSPFGRARTAAFRKTVEEAGATFHAGGEFSNNPADPDFCSHEAIDAWLSGLPKPCGVFAACDNWARPVATFCRHQDLRIPEDISLVGVDNDRFVCELLSPPLSSVAVPWREMGNIVARMIDDHLNGRAIDPLRVSVKPIGVVTRRSSDVLAIDDPEVAAAVAWIRRNANRPISVPDILRAVPTYRQKLERRFRAVLGRTVMDEVRRAHVDLAKSLLMTTQLAMPEIATASGFSNATLLGIAFRRETGLKPSEYRRRFRTASGGGEDEETTF